jgi:hypothetical protein
MNIIKLNQLMKYINEKCISLIKVDEFDLIADQATLEL